MKPRLKSTRAARDLIKTHEPFHGEAVRRGKRWVVGYGHTAAAKAGVSLSREDAELLLIYDVLQAETAVHTVMGEDLAAPVRDALVSFAASVGTNAFKVSDVARLARAGKLEAAAAALETWVRAEEDGRLVTSERLASRRAAEKALMMRALQPDAAEPAPEPEQQQQPEPEPEVQPGPLIDVDIAFEDPEDAAPPAEAEAESVPEPDPEPDPAGAPEPEAQMAPQPEPAAPESPAPAASETQPEADTSAAVKAAQDAAIQAVMARMAGDIAQSVSVTGEATDDHAVTPEPAAPDPEPAASPDPDQPSGDLRLGYSFLAPAVVGVEIDSDEANAPAAPPSEPEPPQPAVTSAAPGPVYASVSVDTVPQAETAPPHPAEAPAAAPGLSGESEGPDHPEESEVDEAGEDEAELEPALVAGPEAAYAGEETPPGAVEARGDWVHAANLAAGAALAGTGGWQLVANLDAYLTQGLGYNWFGPAAFAGGVLLLVSSGWVVVGKMTSKKPR